MKIGRIGCMLAAVAVSLVLGANALAAPPEWMENFAEAAAKAKKENKMLLMDFTGSDWCMPCMAMKQAVFDQKAFQGYADKNLVLLEIDFPQGKQLPPQQAMQNEMLAEKFGVEGFPTLVLLSAQGKPLGIHTRAFLSPDEFIEWVEAAAKGSGAGG